MQHILGFYRYNSNVRKKYLDAIERLPWEEITRDRGASFPSIRDVFLHVLEAYRYWFEEVIGGALVTEHPPENFEDLASMRELEQEVDAMAMKVVENLREEDLSKVYTVQSTDIDDVENVQISMESILMHMIEEELQHRGELNCLFWQQNIDPPVTGYGRWLRETRRRS